MLDAANIAQICRGLSAAAISPEFKKRHFGGKQIIFLGDLMQLPPVSECRSVKPLYEDMVKFSLHQNSSRFNQDKRLTDGLFLFGLFRKFELTIQMRSKDRVHTNHITAMRTSDRKNPVRFYVVGFPSLSNFFSFCMCVCFTNHFFLFLFDRLLFGGCKFMLFLTLGFCI